MQKNLRIEYRDRESGTTTIFTDWFSAEKHATILQAKGVYSNVYFWEYCNRNE